MHLHLQITLQTFKIYKELVFSPATSEKLLLKEDVSENDLTTAYFLPHVVTMETKLIDNISIQSTKESKLCSFCGKLQPQINKLQEL